MTLNEACISIGITGSREELPAEQRESLADLLETYLSFNTPGRRQVRHGCATGTDETAHDIARKIPGVEVYGYPGFGASKTLTYQMEIQPDQFYYVFSPAPYKQRNTAIVTASNILIACPRYPENDKRSLRSGTWQTVRLARRARISVLIVTANGTVTGIL